jgi:hypothetical protein
MSNARLKKYIRRIKGYKQDLLTIVSTDPSNETKITAANGITISNRIMRVIGDSAPITVTAIPSINSNFTVDGYELIIEGRSDTNTLTLQDEANLPGSKLQLEGNQNITLKKGDILRLIYNALDDKWNQSAPVVSQSANRAYVPRGAYIFQAIGVTGAATHAELLSLGYARCDGTTPAFQGVVNPVITDQMPDCSGGVFLRGFATAWTSGAISGGASTINIQHSHVADHGHADTISFSDSGHGHSDTISFSDSGHGHSDTISFSDSGHGHSDTISFSDSGHTHAAGSYHARMGFNHISNEVYYDFADAVITGANGYLYANDAGDNHSHWWWVLNNATGWLSDHGGIKVGGTSASGTASLSKTGSVSSGTASLSKTGSVSSGTASLSKTGSVASGLANLSKTGSVTSFSGSTGTALSTTQSILPPFLNVVIYMRVA